MSPSTDKSGAEQKRSPRGVHPFKAVGMPVHAATAPRPGKKPTIYDLARLAGVSPGTVSRVLNNRDKVKPETRELVLRTAKELNLKPQVSVRARQVAILSEPTFTDRIEGYAATLTAHLSFAFSRRNIGVILPSNPLEQLPGAFLDGVIAVTFDKDLTAMLAELEQRLPIVYMDKFDCSPQQYAVCSDHYTSGYLAAKHFLERGRRKLAFMGGDAAPVRERLRGYTKAIEESGLSVDERLLKPIDAGTTHPAAVARLVKGGADAIFAPGTSFQAMECLHILSYVMGVKVPQDVALIGGENEGVSCLQNPPLTAIEDPLREMAEQAVEMMDTLTTSGKVAKRRLTMPVRLIPRDSV